MVPQLFLRSIHGALMLSVLVAHPNVTSAQTNIAPDEARAIAKEAYIYGYPMVDSYRIQYAYFVDTKDPEYKGPVEPAPQHTAGLHTRGQGGPDAQLGHPIFHNRHGPARGAHCAHRASD